MSSGLFPTIHWSHKLGNYSHPVPNTGTLTANTTARDCRERKQLCLSIAQPTWKGQGCVCSAPVPCSCNCSIAVPLLHPQPSKFPTDFGAQGWKRHCHERSSRDGKCPGHPALDLGLIPLPSPAPSLTPVRAGKQSSAKAGASLCTVCQYLDGSLSALNYSGYFYTASPLRHPVPPFFNCLILFS